MNITDTHLVPPRLGNNKAVNSSSTSKLSSLHTCIFFGQTIKRVLGTLKLTTLCAGTKTKIVTKVSGLICIFCLSFRACPQLCLPG